MRTVVKLTFAFFREHPTRVVLTSLATVAAACLVVWVVSGYDTLIRSFGDFSDKALGRYTLCAGPITTFQQYAPGAIPATAEKFVPPEVAEQMRADPRVAAADPMWAQPVAIRPANPSAIADGGSGQPAGLPGKPAAKEPSLVERRGEADSAASASPQGHPARSRPSGTPGAASRSDFGGDPGRGPRMPDVRLLATNATAPPFPLLRGRWISPGPPDLLEAAISAEVAQRLNVNVGGELVAGAESRSCRLRVVGIVNTPAIGHMYGNIAARHLRTPSVGGLYLSTALAERIRGEPARISFVGVALKPDADITQFRFAWAPRLSRFSTPCQFQDTHDVEESLDRSATAGNFRMQAYAATGMSLLAALFIIFSTLNVGVSERIRQFAMLRAVILTRSQVALMIALEGLVLATIGFVGGIAAGQCVLGLASKSAPQLFHASAAPGEQATMGINAVLMAAACAYGGALLALLVPAYRATRVRPLDAMAPRSTAGSRGVPVAAVVLGLALIPIHPLLTFVIPVGDTPRYVLYLLVGGTSMSLGFVLVAPAVVAVVDRWMSPVLARLFRIDPKLLASQITSNLWRTVGTAVALTIGLGVYIAMQVWGYSMLESFIPGRWAPDAMVALGSPGLLPDEVAAVARLPGVDPNRCLPLVFEQARLLEDLTHSAERASVTRQDNVLIVGLDLKRALGGDHPLLKWEWVQGSPEQALALVEQGRGCVVPDHFLRETGLRVGDAFALVPPDDPNHPVRYTIAGAVRLPGWHLLTKFGGFRTRTHRAAALVFAGYPRVAKDFNCRAASYVWLSFGSTPADKDGLSAAIQAFYADAVKRRAPSGSAAVESPRMRVMVVEDMRRNVRAMAQQWIWATSQLPLITLLVTCIGVLNGILASVRARRWEMGVLRAIGFSRATLVRLVIAEGLLVAIVACVLSLGLGIMAGWCGTGISQYISFFGGLNPPLVIPWSQVGLGLLVVLLLCTLAAIWPAVSIGRTHPLTLLQQGRNAF
jgi:putative ABC transport system permease protein